MHVKLINYVKNKISRIISKAFDLKIYFIQALLKKKIPPVAIYIEPTNICNANCIFCAYQFYDAKKGTMDIELLEIILKEVVDLKINKINLTPFAGEIFTDKRIMKKINLIGQYNFNSFSTYTNLINLKNINIKEVLNSGLTEINISTSPLDEQLYEKIYRSKAYKQFLNNLVLFLHEFNSSNNKTVKKIQLEFRSNMSLKECKELDDYKVYIEKLITNDIHVSAMQTFDSWMGVIQKEDLLDGMNIAKPNGKKIIPCSRLNHIQVLSNGNMRACGCRFDNESKEDIFYIGNVKNMSIVEAYNSKKVLDIKRSFIKNNPPMECQKCSWYS